VHARSLVRSETRGAGGGWGAPGMAAPTRRSRRMGSGGRRVGSQRGRKGRRKRMRMRNLDASLTYRNFDASLAGVRSDGSADGVDVRRRRRSEATASTCGAGGVRRCRRAEPTASTCDAGDVRRRWRATPATGGANRVRRRRRRRAEPAAGADIQGSPSDSRSFTASRNARPPHLAAVAASGRRRRTRG
jgi:hypothetical protein